MFARVRTFLPSQPSLLRAFPKRFNHTDANEELVDVLIHEAQPQKGVEPPVTSRGRPFKSYRKSAHLTPRNLSYDDRLIRNTFRKRRPLVGPPSGESRYNDYFHQLNIDPLSECLNASMLSTFVSEMGKIHGRAVTKLTMKDQRKIGKAIRRAKMMGVIPILSRQWIQKLQHPRY